MNTVRDVVSAIEALIPIELAATWDNVGLVVGDFFAECSNALLTIDLTPEVIDEARGCGATFVLAYHPPIFKAVRHLRARDIAYEAARAGLSVYSPHTAFDATEFGTTATVAAALDFRDEPLILDGSARVHTMKSPLPFDTFVAHLKSRLGLTHVLVSSMPQRRVHRVCVCAGAGGSFIDAAAAEGADTILAGELSHHDVLRARRLGLAVACTFHSNTERPALLPLAERLKSALPSVEFRVSEADRDPFSVM